MSTKENPCRKFQANIFNKSKCQNCFKPRESHLLTDEDFAQAKPIYGGWLLLAPHGTNFDNPLHRSRKWQRRFFLLYEHGLLRYALDEMASTLPQGTINLNVCVDVVDGESTTGHTHSLCISTPECEYYIRAENKEIISGWQEALIVFPRTNKQNQKKKRKVEPPTPQGPGPAKVAVTSSSSLGCLGSSVVQTEGAESLRASVWPEEQWSTAGLTNRAGLTSSHSTSCLSQAAEDSRPVIGGRKPRVESGYFSLEKTKPEQQQQQQQQHDRPLSYSSSRLRRSQVIERFETQQSEDVLEHMDTTSSSTEPSSSTNQRTEASSSSSSSSCQRTGRSERRLPTHQQDMSLDAGLASSAPPIPVGPNCRRAKSLDRRVTESSMTPDLLNFKKGWMTKLYKDGLWKKHWFVLTDQTLKYYRDSIAEEAADLDGEIDLSTCYDVTEFPVQRNYGFQIHSKDGPVTLSAMTSGIRRNWIQAIMKSVRPTIIPDVTRKNVSLKLSVLKPSSLTDEQTKMRAPLDLTKPSPDSQTAPTPKIEVQRSYDISDDSAPPHEQRKLRVRDRRREGRSKTFDWAEFRLGEAKEGPEQPTRKGVESSDLSSSSSPQTPSSVSGPSHLERKCSHQEEEVGWDRRRCFHPSPSLPSTIAVALATEIDGQCNPLLEDPQTESHDRPQMEVDSAAGMGGDSRSQGANGNSDVQVEIEQRWHQVETTPLREEKQVPITGSTAHLPSGDRTAPPQELAAQLDKELGQTQKELARLQEQNSVLQDQLQNARGREHSARETCERGFVAMEQTHQKVLEDLQRQHQREISKLLEERERLLEEETHATIAAIEAMKNAHREELEKTQRTHLSGVSADVKQLHLQYEEELQSIHRELEVLSEQYSQKCLENTHLVQALEAERQALQQCQRENQQLHTHNQELNNRLAAEISRMRSCLSGEKTGSPLTQDKGLYELEVLLRIKESEIQYLKQEITSLKDELQSALQDKRYACDKYKDIYRELSIVRAKADCDISKLREKLLAATEALGDKEPDRGAVTPGYDIMKSKSNPDFLKNERSGLSKQVRGVRSKSVSEDVPWDS